jgi:thiamine pyrophosphokinase
MSFPTPDLSYPTAAFPPFEANNLHGIICEGPIDKDCLSKEKVKKTFLHFTAINSGMLFCQANKLPISFLIGHKIPLDSLAPNSKVSAITTSAEKNYTNLEFAIANAQSSYPDSRIMVYGALTRRIDHTIHNLSLLLKYPGKVCLASQKEIVFGASFKEATSCWLNVKVEGYKTIGFFPIDGPSGSLHLRTQSESIVVSRDLMNFKLCQLPYNLTSLQLRSFKGKFVIYMHKDRIYNSPTVEDLVKDQAITIKDTSFLDKGVIKAFNILFFLRKMPSIKLVSGTEVIYVILPSSEPKPFTDLRGRVVSLIPFCGSVSGIKTEGLKWEIGQENSCDTLDHTHNGISNIVISNSFTVKILQKNDTINGLLLLVVTNITVPSDKITPASSKKSNISSEKSNTSSEKSDYKEGISKINLPSICSKTTVSFPSSQATSKVSEYSNN